MEGLLAAGLDNKRFTLNPCPPTPKSENGAPYELSEAFPPEGDFLLLVLLLLLLLLLLLCELGGTDREESSRRRVTTAGPESDEEASCLKGRPVFEGPAKGEGEVVEGDEEMDREAGELPGFWLEV